MLKEFFLMFLVLHSHVIYTGNDTKGRALPAEHDDSRFTFIDRLLLYVSISCVATILYQILMSRYQVPINLTIAGTPESPDETKNKEMLRIVRYRTTTDAQINALNKEAQISLEVINRCLNAFSKEKDIPEPILNGIGSTLFPDLNFVITPKDTIQFDTIQFIFTCAAKNISNDKKNLLNSLLLYIHEQSTSTNQSTRTSRPSPSTPGKESTRPTGS